MTPAPASGFTQVSKVEPAEEVVYNVPKPVGFAHIAEHFDDLDAFKER